MPPFRKRGAFTNGSSKRFRNSTRAPARASVTSVPRTYTPRTSALEVKDHIADPWNNSTMQVNGMVANLSRIQIGSSGHQRNGRVVKGKSLTWRMFFIFGGNALGGASTASVRVLFFRWDDDREPNEDDVLSNQNSYIVAPYNLDNAFKLRVLYDKIYPLNTRQAQQGTGNYAPSELTLQGALTCNWQMAYEKNNEAQDKGALYCMVFCSQSNYASITMASQLMFTDI